MKVVFNGVVERRKSGGCKCRGGNKTQSRFVNRKTYIMPSGKMETFVKGQETEVSDRDGKFLLSNRYADTDGTLKDAFSEVN